MRFHDLSIFTDPTIPSEINLQRLDFALASGVPLQVGMQPRVIDKALYNKPVEWSWRIIRNYLTTFSTDFLFIKGDPEARHSPAKDSIGMLHLVEIVPLLLGFIYIAIADLVPELHKTKELKHSLIQIAVVTVGIFSMLVLTFFE